MGLINWDNSFSVEIASIDGQHRKLIDMINSLNDAMKQGKGKEALGKIINELVEYAGTHFNTEEGYFAKYGYQETLQHKKEHSDFTKKVLEFKQKFDSGQLGLSIEVMKFLSGWIEHHIKVIDKRYGPFLLAKGVR